MLHTILRPFELIGRFTLGLLRLAVSIPLGAITAFLMTVALRARRNKVVTGAQGLVGETGVAQTALSPPQRKPRSKNFDRNCALQPRIPRAIHFARAARAQRRDDLIRTKPVPSRYTRHWLKL